MRFEDALNPLVWWGPKKNYFIGLYIDGAIYKNDYFKGLRIDGAIYKSDYFKGLCIDGATCLEGVQAVPVGVGDQVVDSQQHVEREEHGRRRHDVPRVVSIV